MRDGFWSQGYMEKVDYFSVFFRGFRGYYRVRMANI
jgi:hypothetical protein